MKFQDWILDDAEHIADVLQSESGKPGVEAAMEAPMCADVLNYWARRAEAFLADGHPKPGGPLDALRDGRCYFMSSSFLSMTTFPTRRR